MRIDADELAEQLGVPVVPIQANKKRAWMHLRTAIAAAASAGHHHGRPAISRGVRARG